MAVLILQRRHQYGDQSKVHPPQKPKTEMYEIMSQDICVGNSLDFHYS